MEKQKKGLIFYGDKTEEGKEKRLSPISNYWIIPSAGTQEKWMAPE